MQISGNSSTPHLGPSATATNSRSTADSTFTPKRTTTQTRVRSETQQETRTQTWRDDKRHADWHATHANTERTLAGRVAEKSSQSTGIPCLAWRQLIKMNKPESCAQPQSIMGVPS